MRPGPIYSSCARCWNQHASTSTMLWLGFFLVLIQRRFSDTKSSLQRGPVSLSCIAIHATFGTKVLTGCASVISGVENARKMRGERSFSLLHPRAFKQKALTGPTLSHLGARFGCSKQLLFILAQESRPGHQRCGSFRDTH